jgi:hypothetical protein
MKRIRTAGVILMGLMAACGDAPTSPEQLSLSSAPDEIVSESMVDEAASLTDRAEYKTDIANSDRVCDISDRTVATGRELAAVAGHLSDYLDENYPRTTSARSAPLFAGATAELYDTLLGPASCRAVVHAFLDAAHAGHTLGRALIDEGLIRRDDRVAKMARQARGLFADLRHYLRHDLSNQVTDRRLSDQP